MRCAQCEAFLAAYNLAETYYSDLSTLLAKIISEGDFKNKKYPNLRAKVEQARVEAEMSREALRIHREGHQRS